MPSFVRLPSILTLLGVLSLSGLGGCASLAHARGDEAVLEMHQAFKKGERQRLATLLPQVQGHPLEPLAAYAVDELRIL